MEVKFAIIHPFTDIDKNWYFALHYCLFHIAESVFIFTIYVVFQVDELSNSLVNLIQFHLLWVAVPQTWHSILVTPKTWKVYRYHCDQLAKHADTKLFDFFAVPQTMNADYINIIYCYRGDRKLNKSTLTWNTAAVRQSVRQAAQTCRCNYWKVMGWYLRNHGQPREGILQSECNTLKTRQSTQRLQTS